MLRFANWSRGLRLRKAAQSKMVLKNTGAIFNVPIRPNTMMAMEDKLPPLPVPPLQQTMDKYIKALEPIMFESEYENTKEVVYDFAKPGGIGEKLQNKLIEKAKTTDNWLADWWDSCAYFGYRSSVVINSSPGIAYPEKTFQSDLDQYRYAAKIIRVVVEFKDLVDSEALPLEYIGKSPLAMIQYKKILSSCRIPHPKEDGSVFASRDESKHMIVAHNGHFFKLDLYKGDTLLTEDELVCQLRSVVDMSSEENEYPVGVLTAQDRNVWAQGYKRLARDSQNKENIDKIQKSICLICLDQPVEVLSGTSPPKYESVFHSTAVAQCLHGGGSEQNSLNRWFDKAIQIVINRNGIVGTCYEHSPAEGPPVMTLGNALMKINIEPDPAYEVPSHIDLEPPEKLSWNLNYDLVDRIELAKDFIDSTSSDVELRLFKFNDFGKSVPKKYKLSPDAFFQVSLQLAYYRLHMHHPPTYESASIRKFSRGRTETIRSATPECARYVREMDRNTLNDAEKRTLFVKAIEAHVNYTREAMNFNVIDRHMLGLKLIALENGMPVPEIFRDKAFGYAMHFRLSTSQVPSLYEASLCFGPVVPDGYGVCYNPMQDKFIYNVSAFYSHPKTHAGDLGTCIAKALQDNYTLLANQSKL